MEWSYSFTFYVDSSHDTISEFKAKVLKLISKYTIPKDVEFDVEGERTNFYILTLKGKFDAIDSCHLILRNELLGMKKIQAFIVVDEVGDELRQKAYILLSAIEQTLRRFINRVMTNAIGYEWWSAWSPIELQQKADERVDSSTYSPIELIDFGELLSIMTGTVQDWGSNQELSVSNLQTLLENSTTIEDIKRMLAEKSTKRSLWDSIVTRYIGEDAEQWQQLLQKINEDVVPMRNSVMHHRPFFQYSLVKILKIHLELETLSSKASTEISEAERAPLKELGIDIILQFQESMREEQKRVARMGRIGLDMVQNMSNNLQREQEKLQRFSERLTSRLTV